MAEIQQNMPEWPRNMKRYLVELVGEPADLEEFPCMFPDGDVHAIAEDTNVFLTGSAFDGIETPSKVLETAGQVLDEMVAVILLLWPGLRRPTLGAVCVEDESGLRSRHFFASVHEMARAKDRVEAVLNGATPNKQGPTEGQQLLAASRLATNAQAAMMIWADPHRTWPRLYRILEELEAELKAKVHESGLCLEDQRTRFTRSANSADVAGKDSRHGSGKFEPPKNPMSLEEATSFISGLMQQTLHRLLRNTA